MKLLNFSAVALTFFCCALLLPGPATAGKFMDKVMASWVGASLDGAIRQWGFPDDEKTIAGRHIFIWLDDAGGVGNLANCERILQVNSKQVVIATDYKGINCPFMAVGAYKNWRKKESN